jgi:hypothetical protein
VLTRDGVLDPVDLGQNQDDRKTLRVELTDHRDVGRCQPIALVDAVPDDRDLLDPRALRDRAEMGLQLLSGGTCEPISKPSTSQIPSESSLKY